MDELKKFLGKEFPAEDPKKIIKWFRVLMGYTRITTIRAGIIKDTLLEEVIKKNKKKEFLSLINQ